MIDSPILRSFAGADVLVTGGTGLIGRQVVDILVATGAHVRIASLDQVVVNPGADHVVGDLASFEFCKEVASGADYVFHLAGIKGSIEVTRSRPASFFVPLLMMNTNMLEAARLSGARKVVFTSSIGAYPSAEVFKESDDSGDSPPMDMYPGWAKRMAEMQVRAYREEYGLDGFAVVRPCNVYGPGDNFDPDNAMVIPSLMARIRAGESPLTVWGDGSAVRDFAYSRDVAEGVILALHHGTGGGFVNLGSGEGFSIRKLVETLHEFIEFDYAFDPTRGAGFPRRVMDISLARELVGYEPATSLRDGLELTWDWYGKNADQHLKKVNYFRAADGDASGKQAAPGG